MAKLPRESIDTIVSHWRQYLHDQSAAVTIAIVVFFALLLGAGGLVFDVARVFNLHSQSQAYVDNVALASAAELDGKPGALVRALRAAVGDGTPVEYPNGLLNAGYRLTLSGDSSVNVETVAFLEDIAPDPMPGTRSPVVGDEVLCTLTAGDTPAAAGCPADADSRARFVLVTSTAETENFILFPLVSAFVPGAMQDATVSPQAIAGFKGEICNFPPLSICNPYESTTAPYGGGFNATIGQQILLKMQGGPSSSWTPGDFGLLSPNVGAGGSACSGSGSGANLTRCILAVVDPNTQCTSTAVDIQPGQSSGPVKDGLNVRFDIWDAPLNSKQNDPRYAPSANVTKGRTHAANQCTFNKLNPAPVGASNTVPLPRDSCFATASCTGGNRFGNGVTAGQLQAYWTINHGGALPAGLSTRYDVYRYEIDNGLIPNKSPTGENGNPTCSTSTPVSNPLRDRRILNVAIINCREHNVHGNQTDIPTVAFAKMFVTEPIGLDAPSNNDLYAEVLGIVEPGDTDGVLHEFPVLYR